MAEENMKTAAEEAAETCAEESVEETAAETAAENAEPEVEVVDNSAEEKIAMLTDQLQRIMAEFENFRKRTEKEKEARFDMGAKSVIEKILPVIDNFERGLGGVSEEQKEDPFVSGMDRVYRQMMTELEGIGVKAIEFGEPIEIGALAVFLASPAAAQITGTVQVIDGGYILSC